MKKFYFVICFVLASLFAFSQSDGDFQSSGLGTGNWTDLTSWEVYDSSVMPPVWLPATMSTGYPGQISTTANVLIQANHTITITTDTNVSQPFGDLNLVGTLLIDISGNPDVIDLNPSSINIDGINTPGLGILNFIGSQVRLNLPASTIVTVENGGTLNACLLYTSPSPRDRQKSRMPSSA